MPNLHTLYCTLAQAISNAMACPGLAELNLRSDAAVVCQAAKLPGLPEARPTSKSAALGQLALALAAVLEHEQLPVDVYNALTDLSCALTSELRADTDAGQYEAAALRWHVRLYATNALQPCQ